MVEVVEVVEVERARYDPRMFTHTDALMCSWSLLVLAACSVIRLLLGR